VGKWFFSDFVGNGRILEVPISWHTRRSGKSKVSGTLRGSLLAAYYILCVTLKYSLSPT